MALQSSKPIVRQHRVDLAIRVELKYLDRDVFVERFAQNVSRTGLFVRAKDPPAVGSRVRFEYKLADGTRLLRGVGIVRWARTAAMAKEPDLPAGMGIEFVDLDADSEELIGRIVARHGEGERAPRRAVAAARPAATVGATGAGAGSPRPAARPLDREEETALDSLLEGLGLGDALPSRTPARRAAKREHGGTTTGSDAGAGAPAAASPAPDASGGVASADAGGPDLHAEAAGPGEDASPELEATTATLAGSTRPETEAAAGESVGSAGLEIDAGPAGAPDLASSELGAAPGASFDLAGSELDTAPGASSDLAGSEVEAAPDASSDLAGSEPDTAPGASSDLAGSEPDTAPGASSDFAGSELDTAPGASSDLAGSEVDAAPGASSDFAGSELDTAPGASPDFAGSEPDAAPAASPDFAGSEPDAAPGASSDLAGSELDDAPGASPDFAGSELDAAPVPASLALDVPLDPASLELDLAAGGSPGSESLELDAAAEQSTADPAAALAPDAPSLERAAPPERAGDTPVAQPGPVTIAGNAHGASPGGGADGSFVPDRELAVPTATATPVPPAPPRLLSPVGEELREPEDPVRPTLSAGGAPVADAELVADLSSSAWRAALVPRGGAFANVGDAVDATAGAGEAAQALPSPFDWLVVPWPAPRARVLARRLGLELVDDESGFPAVRWRGLDVSSAALLQLGLEKLLGAVSPSAPPRHARIVLPAAASDAARRLLLRRLSGLGVARCVVTTSPAAVLARVPGGGATPALVVEVLRLEARLALVGAGGELLAARGCLEAGYDAADAAVSAALARVAGVGLAAPGAELLAAVRTARRAAPAGPWLLAAAGEEHAIETETVSAGARDGYEALALAADELLRGNDLDPGAVRIVVAPEEPLWPGLAGTLAEVLGARAIQLEPDPWIRLRGLSPA